MSDSDDDLLALAGMGSDEEVQNESDYEPEIPTGRRLGSRKRKQGTPDKETEEVDEEDPYPLEGKYKDDEDRAKLMSMDEMTREQILYDRLQEKEKYRERRYLALRARQSKAESTTIKAGSKSKKLRTSKLSELKRQRERKNEKNNKRKGETYDDEDDEDEYGEGEEDDDRDLEELAGYGDEYDDDAYYSDEYKSKKLKTKKQEEEYDDKYYRDATLDDLNSKIRSSRSVLSKYLYRDEFDKVIPGTFVRVNIGISRANGRPQYRIGKVEEVKRGGKTYDLLGKPCNTYLSVSQGSSKKILDMSCISDSSFTLDEFTMYKKRLDDSNQELPSLGEVEDKFKELRAMSTKSLTNEDINHMIANKEQILMESMDSAARVRKVARLREELQVANEQADEERIKDLKKAIDELNKSSQGTSNTSKLEKINLRNQKSNQESIRKAEKKNAEVRRKQMLNNDFSDPFSRLRTNPKIFYTSDAQKSNADNHHDDSTQNESKDDVKTLTNCLYRREGIDTVIKDIQFDFNFDL